MSNASQPTMQHFPHPRATTAAWLVLPPVAVKIPCAAFIPPTSSGLVSRRTRITFSPRNAHSSASCAVKTALPVAAPGTAFTPVAILRFATHLLWPWAQSRDKTTARRPPAEFFAALLRAKLILHSPCPWPLGTWLPANVSRCAFAACTAFHLPP